MMIRVSRCLRLVAVAVWATACSPAPTAIPTPTASPSASPSTSASIATTVADVAGGISFQRPATWTRWQPNQSKPINGGPLIYLSTDPLLPTCATAPEAMPNPPDLRGMACDWPLASLSPNGVFVAWVNKRILGPLPTTGEVIAMNGASARLQIARPGGCSVIASDESISVWVPIGQPTPLSNLVVFACLQGPDLAAAEAQVRAMLASATVAR